MKQALVLGLALAANAMNADQVDNELIVVPTGGKFGDLAKFPTKMGRVMFDEQADDELLAMRKPREESKHDIYLKNHPERPQYYTGLYFKAADDEELFVAPQGKLADLTKKYPGMIMFDEQADDELLIRPTVAADDDEFMVRLLPREHFQTEEEYQKYIAKMRFYRDDEELFVAPQGKLGELAKKYPGKIMFDEADDELFGIKKPREESKMTEEYRKAIAKKYGLTHFDEQADDELRAIDNLPRDQYGNIVRPPYARFDEVADDELLIRPLVSADDDEFIAILLPREHFKTEEEYQKYVAKMRFHRDDEELFVAPQGRLGELVKKYPGKIMFDEADDELFAMKKPREESKMTEEYRKFIAKKYGLTNFDEQADDELFGIKKPREESKMTEEYRKAIAKKYGLTHFDEQADDEFFGVNKQEWSMYLKNHPELWNHNYNIPYYKAADDDEFMVRLLPRESFQTEEEYQKYLAKWRFQRDDEELFVAPQGKLADLAKKYPGMIMFDEQADDELVYLGHLIRHAENDKLAPFRTFADDELRAEKPSHVKAQEKAQMKAELPRMKRKLRPADETALLA